MLINPPIGWEVYLYKEIIYNLDIPNNSIYDVYKQYNFKLYKTIKLCLQKYIVYWTRRSELFFFQVYMSFLLKGEPVAMRRAGLNCFLIQKDYVYDIEYYCLQY